GKQSIPPCTAYTIRMLGTRRINDAAIISAGSRKISSQYSPNARAVAMLPPAIVANTSGARQRVITNTVAMLKVEAPRLSRAENQDPPINNTKAEAQTPLATNDTQCGKVFFRCRIAASAACASSRETSPAAIPDTSAERAAKPAKSESQERTTR